MGDISRRSFVSGVTFAAVGAALAGATGCTAAMANDDKLLQEPGVHSTTHSWEASPEVIADSDLVEEVTADIVICGAGLAGLAAACRASELGAKVIVFEKSATPSSRGGHYAAYHSKAMTAAGCEQMISKEELLRDWVRVAGNRCNEKLAWRYIDQSETAFNWLYDKAGAELKWVVCDTRNRNPLYTEYPGTHCILGADNDQGLNPPHYYMWKKAEDQGAEFRFSTPGMQLVVDAGGAVTGVIAKSEAGYIKASASKGVVLATGDISGDAEMLAAFAGDFPAKYKYTSLYTPAGMNTGDGQKMAMWAGGHMEMTPAPCMVHLNHYTKMCFGGLYVDSTGNRFMNEDTWIQAKSVRILQQPSGEDYAWSIFDTNWTTQIPQQLPYAGGQFWDDMVHVYGANWKPDKTQSIIADSIKNGMCFTANTIDELAKSMGVDASKLKTAVDTYNKYADAGDDGEYHKRQEILTTSTVKDAPFYAIKFGPALLCCPSGVEVDESCAVLDKAKKPIKGLYAIGNAMGGRYGVDYPVLINGNSHGSALTFGYLIGTDLAS